MKFFSKLAVTSAVLALAFISTASAQSMRVNVPFGFHAGDQALPAGTYKVDLNQRAQGVRLSTLDGKANCLLNVKALGGSGVPDTGSLVFHRYANSYFLAKVKPAGVAGGAELFTSRAERELAKVQPEPKSTLIIASSR